MKKTLLIFAAVGMAFFASCDGDIADTPEIPVTPKTPDTPELPESVASTCWAAESAEGDVHELTVTATEATYTFRERGGYRWTGRGKYTYEKPALTFSVYDWSESEPVTITGTVTDEDTMSVEVSGIVRAAADAITLTKQTSKQAVPPTEPTLVGNWRLMSEATIKEDGTRDEEEHSGSTIYTFLENGSGWLYSDNYFQHSFAWAKIDDDGIRVFDWEWGLKDIKIVIDPSGYDMSEEWSVRQLTTGTLVLSFAMTPHHGYELEPIVVELGLEREL